MSLESEHYLLEFVPAQACGPEPTIWGSGNVSNNCTLLDVNDSLPKHEAWEEK